MIDTENPGALANWAAPYGRDDASGMRLLSDGLEAFETRAHLARHAQHRIDVMIYLLEDGTTSRVLMAEMLAAAERGVAVRLLVDDLSAIKVQRALRALDTHSRIEVRLFNPITFWRRYYWSHRFAMGLTLKRSHRRMHNKLFLVDDAVGIAGGRNLSDDYFITDSEYNFADLDMLVAGGRVADQMRRCFSEYWHGCCVQTLSSLVDADPDFQWSRLRDELKQQLMGEELASSPYLPIHKDGTRELAKGLGEVVRAEGQLHWDHPDKACQPGYPSREYIMAPTLGRLIAETRQQLKLVSAYFIPSERDVIDIEALLRQGVAVTVLTNSLQDNDTPIVNGGYAPWRQRFLDLGASMHELRHGQKPHKQRLHHHFGALASSLHGKAMVMDRKRIFIGSFNVDPRSIWWNNEMVLQVDHEALAQQLDDIIDLALAPACSFRVEQEEGGKLVWWTTDKDNQELRITREPGSWLARCQKWLGGLPGVSRLL